MGIRICDLALMRLVFGNVFGGVRDALRQKRLVDNGSDAVHPGLKTVEIFVQPLVDNLLHLRARQVGTEQVEQFFRIIAEASEGRSRDGVQRIAGRVETKADGARKLSVQEEKLHDASRRNTPVPLP